jgi:PP-loop superfamily ATP-utilizing enzyme
MKTEQDLLNIKIVIHITTNNYSSRCNLCNELPTSFQDAINHYLSKHNYKLLNAGTESSQHSDGSLVHDTAVLLGN